MCVLSPLSPCFFNCQTPVLDSLEIIMTAGFLRCNAFSNFASDCDLESQGVQTESLKHRCTFILLMFKNLNEKNAKVVSKRNVY